MKDLFARIAQLQEENIPFALATIISVEGSTPREGGARMIVFPDGSTEGTIGGGEIEKRVSTDAVELLEKKKSERRTYDLSREEEKGEREKSKKEKPAEETKLDMLCGGRVEVLIESFTPTVTLFIFGAGHIGTALAGYCDVLGFSYWLIDNREEYAREERFPNASGVLFSDFEESFEKLPIDNNSSLVIVTYGHRYDAVCLQKALQTEAGYIGMIGSKKKVKANFDYLEKQGSNVKDPRIYSPIGLALGDNSPPEIALSIMAEIVKVNSGGSGRHMRESLPGYSDASVMQTEGEADGET
jgi:xanthine dehydrogenase accessory factor